MSDETRAPAMPGSGGMDFKAKPTIIDDKNAEAREQSWASLLLADRINAAPCWNCASPEFVTEITLYHVESGNG